MTRIGTMNELASIKDRVEINTNTFESIQTKLQAAQERVKHHRTQGWEALNQLFRSGTVPEPPLDGRYAGELIAINIAPGLTQMYESLLQAWMPWLGKTFDPAQQSGDNIFTKDSYPLARIFNPFYRGFVADGPGRYRGFAFRTYTAAGLFDKDRTVLKIDYDLKGNPSLNVRRVLDELVQVGDMYLGKAHVHWWWGRWQTVAYFTLTQKR
jgi:hypothetical protein